MEIKRVYLFLLFQLLQLGAINAGKEKWHHTACVILPWAQPNLRWNFQAQPLDSSSPVRGRGTADPRVRFGGWPVPPAELQAVGTVGLSLGSAAEQPVQHCLWPQHLGCSVIIFSQLDACVCAPCVCTSVPVPTVGLQKAKTVCCKMKSCPHPGSSVVLWPRF